MCEKDRIDLIGSSSAGIHKQTAAFTLPLCLFVAVAQFVLSLVCDRTSLPLWAAKSEFIVADRFVPEGNSGRFKNAESLIDLGTFLLGCLSLVFVFIPFLFQHHYFAAADRKDDGIPILSVQRSMYYLWCSFQRGINLKLLHKYLLFPLLLPNVFAVIKISNFGLMCLFFKGYTQFAHLISVTMNTASLQVICVLFFILTHEL